MKMKLLTSVLCCVALACGAERRKSANQNQPEANPPSAEANSTSPVDMSQPGPNDKKVDVAICLLSGETEESCLAYRIVEAVVGPGLEPKDLAKENFTLTCTAPVGSALSTCQAFRAEVKK